VSLLYITIGFDERGLPSVPILARREDDKLCERWLKEPQPEGFTKGWKADDYIEPLKDEYYGYRGLDRATSLLTRKKLEELDMGDFAEVLARENVLV